MLMVKVLGAKEEGRGAARLRSEEGHNYPPRSFPHLAVIGAAIVLLWYFQSMAPACLCTRLRRCPGHIQLHLPTLRLSTCGVWLLAVRLPVFIGFACEYVKVHMPVDYV